MKNIVSFLIILFLIAVAGVAWGIYGYQKEKNMSTSQILAIIKSYIFSKREKPASPKSIIVKKSSETTMEKPLPGINPPEKSVIEQMQPLIPIEETPVTPTKVESRRIPQPEKPKVKSQSELLIEEGNKYYDEGIVHLQNTFKKDDTFDKENDLAIKNFRQALAKYLEAEKIDSENLWLRNRIRETNGNIITCRRQARRK